MPATLVRNAAGLVCEEVDGVLYPIEEAHPVPQNNWHLILVTELFERLRFLLESHPSAQVFCDMLIYWINGNGEKSLAPNLAVFPAMEEREGKRNIIRLWEEASSPVFVLEALSDSSEDHDLGQKQRTYQDAWRVPEYFVCDPTRGQQRVWGYRRVEGEYQAVEADERGWVWSEELRVWFGADEMGMLGVWDASGQSVSRLDMLIRERNAERERAEQERERAEQERERAEALTLERDGAVAAQEAERQARMLAEQRVRDLEERLRQQQIKGGDGPKGR